MCVCLLRPCPQVEGDIKDLCDKHAWRLLGGDKVKKKISAENRKKKLSDPAGDFVSYPAGAATPQGRSLPACDLNQATSLPQLTKSCPLPRLFHSCQPFLWARWTNCSL